MSKNNVGNGKIVCDSCVFGFPVSAIRIQTSNLRIDNTALEATYFRCPNKDCNKVYVIQVLDNRCIKLREEFAKQKDRVQNNGRSNSTKESSAQYISMLVKRKRYLDRFKMLLDRYGEKVSRRIALAGKEEAENYEM